MKKRTAAIIVLAAIAALAVLAWSLRKPAPPGPSPQRLKNAYPGTQPYVAPTAPPPGTPK